MVTHIVPSMFKKSNNHEILFISIHIFNLTDLKLFSEDFIK